MRSASGESSEDPAADLDHAAFLERAAQERRFRGRFNLAIVGDTGVGKSSLVNAVFGRHLAEVGTGLPVTSGVQYYHDESLGIWDFEGFEIGSSKTPADVLSDGLAAVARRPVDEHIDVVWYCVLASADRLAPPAIEMIRRLDAAGLPVILVLTKVQWKRNVVSGRLAAPDDTTEFVRWLEDPHDRGTPLDVPIQRVILTSTKGLSGKDTGHGLGDLVDETLALCPDRGKNAFRVAQRLNLPWKREIANRTIATAAATAGMATTVPVPVADALTLAPIQLGMMGEIASTYDLDLRSLMSADALAQLSAQIAGRALARSFLKLIPGAGTLINASVATAVTLATGAAWVRLCEQLYTGRLDIAHIDRTWEKFAPTLMSVLKELGKRTLAKD